MTNQLHEFEKRQSDSEILMELDEIEDKCLESEFATEIEQLSPIVPNFEKRQRRSKSIVDSLLFEIYDKLNFGRRFSEDSDANYTEHSVMSEMSLPLKYGSVLESEDRSKILDGVQRFKKSTLESKGSVELQQIICQYQKHVSLVANELLRQLKRRDKWFNKRDRNYDVVTAILQASSLKRSVDARIRFSIEPIPGHRYASWKDAMKMVTRLHGGIPHEFRKRLWLTMANRHMKHQKVDWEKIKRFCFNDRSNPDDNELGVQIVKDLHRTGCGVDDEYNRAILKRVLLAYARFNKTVGYCQGFNMLTALILEVVEWKEEDALKVLIYLIEGVLPESYFASNLHGLSVDMAVFRDLLRSMIPLLSSHLDNLQMKTKDLTSGVVYEPPLTNVFTMQWFLTIFSNCLPKESVLRVWDLIFLEGNEVILRTALVIWQKIANRIMSVKSADEFYSLMGVMTRETMEFGLMDSNLLIKMICTIAPFPFPQLVELRDKYTYNITPFTSTAVAMEMARKSLRLYDSEEDEEDEENELAMAAWCFTNVFPTPSSPNSNKDVLPRQNLSPSASGQNFSSIGPGAFGKINTQIQTSDTKNKNNRETQKMSLDISSLKKQYAKLKERQKQAHVILKTATKRQQISETTERTTIQSIMINHLLVGKKPLVQRKSKEDSSGSQPSTPTSPFAFAFKPLASREIASPGVATAKKHTAKGHSKKLGKQQLYSVENVYWNRGTSTFGNVKNESTSNDFGRLAILNEVQNKNRHESTLIDFEHVSETDNNRSTESAKEHPSSVQTNDNERKVSSILNDNFQYQNDQSSDVTSNTYEESTPPGDVSDSEQKYSNNKNKGEDDTDHTSSDEFYSLPSDYSLPEDDIDYYKNTTEKSSPTPHKFRKNLKLHIPIIGNISYARSKNKFETSNSTSSSEIKSPSQKTKSKCTTFANSQTVVAFNPFPVTKTPKKKW